MTGIDISVKIEILKEIGNALGLPDSAGKTKLLEELWKLYDAKVS